MLSRCCIIGGGASGPCRLEHTARSGPLLSDCSSLSHYNEVRVHCSLLWTSETYKPTSITLISYKRLILVKKKKSIYLIWTAYCWTFAMWVLSLRWIINIHTYMYISWLTDFRSSYWQGNCQYLPCLELQNTKLPLQNIQVSWEQQILCVKPPDDNTFVTLYIFLR